MTKLATDHLLYLLYTIAYSDEGTVTQGTVKRHLSKEQQKNAHKICDTLCQQNLLESPKKSRLSITEQGKKVLVANLQTSDYQFDSSKGKKVLNTLLYCLKITSSEEHTSSEIVDEMDFDTFIGKFKKLYFAERKQQELHGVVAIRSREICQKFMEHNPISQSKLEQYFDQLKVSGQIFAVTEKDEELIQWVE
jgi:hypothetical protein